MSHRAWSRIALMASLAGALLGGCAPGNPGLVVLNVIAPDDACLYDLGNAQITRGILDVNANAYGFPVSYEATIRYGNQLINLGNNGTTGVPMADPNVMQVQEVEVELRGTDGATLDVGGLPNPFVVPAGGGVIPSSDGMAAGEALGSVTLIPEVYGAALAGATGEIVVAFRALGVTAGGAEVLSSEFTFPVSLCNNCLFACQTDDEGVPACNPACLPGQDGVHIAPRICDPASTLVCNIGG